MKKNYKFLLCMLLTLSSCDFKIISYSDYVSLSNEASNNNESVSESSNQSSSEDSKITSKEDNTSSSTVSDPESQSTSSSSSSTQESSSSIQEIAFTEDEQELMMQKAGLIVEYTGLNDYEIDEYNELAYEGYVYYSWGQTSTNFNKYINALKAVYGQYTSYTDDYGCKVYVFNYNNKVIEASFYNDYGDTETTVYVLKSVNRTTTYTAFTNEDEEVLGSIDLPFYPCKYYQIYEDSYYECICYDIYGVTEDDLDTYLNTLKGKFGNYTYDSYYEAYVFETDDYEIDVYLDSYTTNKVDYYYIGVEIYESSGTGGGGGYDPGEETEAITNKGKGLPTGTNGIYNVDFSKAKYDEDKEYYAPSTGNTSVLVVPVQYPNLLASTKGYTIDEIKKAFEHSETEVANVSLYDYYYTSSNGTLDLDIEVLDEWFTTENNYKYYYDKYITESGQKYYNGPEIIMDEIMQYLDNKGVDLTKYDSDDDGYIDAICMISTFDVEEDPSDEDNLFGWAYSTSNYLTDDEGYLYEYDGECANAYFWAPYQFFYEKTVDGERTYDGDEINTYTVIHEFAHVLGLYDYYDTSYSSSGPLEDYDLMDSTFMDHNPYSKFYYQWINETRLVTTDTSITIGLDSFENTGDTIIIGNNFDPDLGVYQEYYIICYYTNEKLNEGRNPLDSGIVVYHVDASLYAQDYSGETYYYIYNDNASEGTTNNLIEFVKNGEEYVYVVGDTFNGKKVYDNNGDVLAYSFTIDSIAEGTATITFTKN